MAGIAQWLGVGFAVLLVVVMVLLGLVKLCARLTRWKPRVLPPHARRRVLAAALVGGGGGSTATGSSSTQGIEQQKQQQQGGGGTQIKVLTYNIFLRLAGVSDKGGDFKAERLRAWEAQWLTEFDVICFQEVFGTLSLYPNKLLRAATSKGYVYHTWPELPPLLGTQLLDSGLMILSRLPIVEQAAITYSAACYVDKLAAKGAVYAKVLLPTANQSQGGYLHVFNTHLQSYYNLDDKPALEVIHLQLKELFAFIDAKTEHDDHDILVAADMNLNALDPAHLGVLKHWFRDDRYKDLLHVTTGEHPPTMHIVYDTDTGAELASHPLPEHLDAPDSAGLSIVPTRVDYLLFRSNRSQKSAAAAGAGAGAGAGTGTQQNASSTAPSASQPSGSALQHVRTTVEPFNEPSVGWGQLSDHAGVVATFKVRS